MPSKERPNLRAALICERVLEEKNGTLTAMRIIDRVNVGFIDIQSGRQGETLPVPIGITVLISCVAGRTRGDHHVRVRIVSPSGEPLGPPLPNLPCHFQKETDGMNFVLNLTIPTKMPGLYWIEVFFGDDAEPMSRVPLEVVYPAATRP